MAVTTSKVSSRQNLKVRHESALAKNLFQLQTISRQKKTVFYSRNLNFEIFRDIYIFKSESLSLKSIISFQAMVIYHAQPCQIFKLPI